MSPSHDGRRSRGRFGLPTPRADEGSLGPDPAEADDLDSYLAALAPDAAGGSTEHTGRFGSSKVFQLRLPAPRIEQLRRLAAERGVSPDALVVDWVTDRLDREYTPTGPLAVVEEAERRRRGPLGRLGRRDR